MKNTITQSARLLAIGMIIGAARSVLERARALEGLEAPEGVHP